MPVEAKVHFLNIDLLLAGRFDRDALLRSLGGRVFVLHQDAVFEGKKCLLLEVTDSGADLRKTLAQLLKWIENLPSSARRSWDAASDRIFDIGIQAGLGPYASTWRVDRKQVAALARVGGEVMVTVYGAKRDVRRVVGKTSPKRARRSGRRRGGD